MAVIKFCENNFSHGTDATVEKLRLLEGVSVEVEPCLGHCGDCAVGPYALVDDEMVQADTPDKLFDKIKEMLWFLKLCHFCKDNALEKIRNILKRAPWIDFKEVSHISHSNPCFSTFENKEKLRITWRNERMPRKSFMGL